VYVNLSHGEGIGMPDLEAMATGLPVIGSNWDTRALFLNEETGWPLKVVGMEQAYRLTVKEDCGEWACFDTEEYVKVLKEIAQSPAVVREKGKRAADSVRARFTPTAAAEALDAVLMEVYERKRTPAGAAYDENYYSQVHKYHEGYYENAAASILAVTGRLQGSVLEVGCGRGYLMKHLLAKGVSVTGIDISDYAVANPLPECAGRIFKGDVLDIPYPDGTFDWGVAFSLLEHIPEKGVAKALQELKRVCKKLFLQIAIPLQPGHEKQIASEDHTHCTLYPIEWWRRRLDEAGLQISLYDGGMSMVVEPRESIMRIFPSDRILVGIPTRDRAQHLAALLRSLLGQSFKQFDVCIVDDSRVTNLPNEAEVTDALNALYMQGHSWFAFRGPAINQAVAHNNVLRFALEKGYKLVLRVDDDVTLEADFLEIMFNEFLKDEECQYAAIGGIYLNPNMRPELQVAPANWREVADFAGSVRHCVYWAQVMRYPDAIEYRDDIQHLYSTYVYRTRLMESVGGFPTDLSAIAHREETIPLYALWLQGYRLKIVTRAVGWHWLAKEGGIRTTPPDKAREMAMADNEVFNRRIAELEARYGKGADHPAHQGPA
jgi:SAM-dependent methyltransferase